ncbi:MAG: TraB/GumN family protein [Bacteroidales bacterium]|jgi:hypothetical protein|nr:TraB/GumN family protein [Bacteroidales bacterium]
MKNKKVTLPALIAILAGIFTVFIARSNDEPSDCFTWKVKINHSTFYLAGSIHAAGEGNYPLPETYLKCYNKADKVIFELEDDFETLEKRIFLYAEKDKLPDGLSLGDSLNSESINKLREIIGNDKLDKCLGYEAWLLNMFIAGNKSKLCGYDPGLAIDKYYHDLATKDKKEIIGLDEIQTQLALFDFDLPFKIQIQILEKAVSEMAMKAKGEEELFKAYFENDLVKFEKEFLKPYDFGNPQMKNIYDMVFTKRNTSWVEKFIELSRGNPGSYFVLVGSGHYFGPNNLLELLESKGYTIEKI